MIRKKKNSICCKYFFCSFFFFFFFHNLTICTALVVEGLLATGDEIEQNLRGSFITSSLRPVA